ncbi:MAG: FlgD immunoglobulin-like domain containing protein [bacterium]
MRLTRVAGISLVMFLMLTGISRAQGSCNEFDKFSTDTAFVVGTSGLPGETVVVPISITNEYDIAGLQIYLEFDSALINPQFLSVDSTIDTALFIECHDSVRPEGDTIVCDTSDTVIDTLIVTDYLFTFNSRFNQAKGIPRVVDEVDFDPPAGRKRVKLVVYPVGFFEPEHSILADTGAVFFIPFDIDPGAATGTSTTISFYRAAKANDSIPPDTIGCIFSQYYDSTGAPLHRLQEVNGVISFQAGLDLPVINSFTATETTIDEGDATTLSWEVTNATLGVTISGLGAVSSSGAQSVSPTTTTIYTMDAENADGHSYASVTITVIPAGSNSRPVFTQPTQTSYEIDQGQTLALQVTSTDADNDNITLTGTSLPGNASFGPTNPVVGVGSVSGNFSFTPDYSQVGVYQATFLADDGKVGGTRQLSLSITVNEIPFDRLFTTSAEGQSPVGGLPGARSVLFPINLVTSQTVYGVQFDFVFDYDYFEVDSFITTPRTENYVIYDNIGQTPGRIKVVAFGVANEPIVTDTASTAILYAVMTIDTTAIPGDYTVLLEDGWESVNPDPDYPSLPLVTDSGIIQVDRAGDVNLDKRVDVADAVNVVGTILGNYTLTPRQFAAGDVIIDSTINVFDLVGIINLIFGIPLSPAAGEFFEGGFATVELEYPDLQTGMVEFLVVKSELPTRIAGVQLEIRYDPNTMILGNPILSSEVDRMVLSSTDNGRGRFTALLYFKSPLRTQDMIQEGEAELLSVPVRAFTVVESGDQSRVRLTRALLSTPAARPVRTDGIEPLLPTSFALQQNYPNPFNPITTIEFSLGAASDGSLTQQVRLDIFNILGQCVRTLLDKKLTPGQYQVDWDATNGSGRQVATGIYLYRLRVGQESSSKKMLLLK